MGTNDPSGTREGTCPPPNFRGVGGGNANIAEVKFAFFHAAEYLFSAIFSLQIYGHNLHRTPRVIKPAIPLPVK